MQSEGCFVLSKIKGRRKLSTHLKNEIPRFVKLQNMGKTKEDMNENIKELRRSVSTGTPGNLRNKVSILLKICDQSLMLT